MTTQENQETNPRVSLRITGLSVPDPQKAALERTADDLAEKVDADSHLDPLDAEPAIVFDPGY